MKPWKSENSKKNEPILLANHDTVTTAGLEVAISYKKQIKVV
jgi:hypothetical protein